MLQTAKPFLKWAGGKSQLLAQFEGFYPQELKNGHIDRYVEPFLGGGAVFFEIIQKYAIKTAFLSDLNPDLVLTYQTIQQNVEKLIERLETYQKRYDQTEQEKRNAFFLEIREDFNRKKISGNEIGRAAQLIFLNKTCFNGLFRQNSKGEFNVPYGKYKTAMIADVENLRAVSRVLQKAEIVHAPYSACFEQVTEKTFVYFDPPYRPLTKTANFTTYIGQNFDDAEQTKLAQFFKKLDQEKHAKLMLSNADPKNSDPDDDFFEKIYENYVINRVSASRAINSDASKRGKVTEVLIRNY